MPKIEDRRFVEFGVGAIEVNLIVAVVSTLLREGENAIVIILETGSTVTLSGESMKLFITWWHKNMKEKGLVEKTSPEEPIVAPSPTLVVPEPAPEPVPAIETTVETVVPNIVSEVASQVAPEPPPPEPVVQPPSLSDIGKI